MTFHCVLIGMKSSIDDAPSSFYCSSPSHCLPNSLLVSLLSVSRPPTSPRLNRVTSIPTAGPCRRSTSTSSRRNRQQQQLLLSHSNQRRPRRISERVTTPTTVAAEPTRSITSTSTKFRPASNNSSLTATAALDGSKSKSVTINGRR